MTYSITPTYAMQDKEVRQPLVPSTITVMGYTFAMPMLLLAIFLAAVALSKPVCEMYSKQFCRLPRFLPKFKR